MRLGADESGVKRTLRGGESKIDVWVRRNDLIEYLSSIADVEESCNGLPFYIVFFILSFVLITCHMNVSGAYDEINLGKVTLGLDDEALAETVGNMGVLEDGFLPWFRDSIIGGLNLEHDKPQRGRVANYLQLLGGIRLRQRRTTKKPCIHFSDKNLTAFYTPVGGVYDPNAELCTDYDKVEVWDGYPTISKSFGKTYTEKASLEQIFAGALPRSELNKKINDLIKNNWIDSQTQFVSFEFLFYNGQTTMFTLPYTEFEMTKGGEVKTKSKWSSFISKPYDQPWMEQWFTVGKNIIFC